MAKANSVISTTLNQSIGTIEFKVAEVGTLVLHMERVSEANRAYAALHGFKQRIQDAAALPCDEVTGKPASAFDKFDAMQELVEFYESGAGDWNRRGGGGGGRPAGGILLQAMIRAYPEAERQVLVDKIDGWDKKQRAAVMARPGIKVHVDAIQAEAVANIDTTDLLAGL
jgi:hypothetical protein